MKVQLAAIKITDETNKMYKIMKETYDKETKGLRELQIANLGHSTDKFKFFVTQSVSQSVSQSQSQGSSSGSLINKLISLSSEGKFSIIDSVVDKMLKKTEEKKISSVEKSSSYEIISTAQKEGSTQQFDIIEEEDEDEEMIDEQDIDRELEKAAKEKKDAEDQNQ